MLLNIVSCSVQQYNTGNYIQYLAITYNGKESETERMHTTHTCIKLNHFSVHLKCHKSAILKMFLKTKGGLKR